MALSDLISELRITIDDNAGDKTVYRENLARSIQGNQVSTGAGSYQLNNKRVVAGSLQVNVDGAGWKVIGSSGGQYPGTENDPRGRFTLVTPAATSLFAIYDFQYFSDTELEAFLDKACTFISESLTDPTQLASGLQDALVSKAAADAAMALSLRRADLYTASTGGKSAQKGDIAKKYRDLSKDLLDRAVAERAAYYGPRKGASSSPATGRRNQSWTPWTPRR